MIQLSTRQIRLVHDGRIISNPEDKQGGPDNFLSPVEKKLS
jgi:hypothetical protein